MKYRTMIALMLISAGTSYAQKTAIISQPQYEVIYDYQVVKGSDETEKYLTMLQIGNTCAKFSDYAAYQLDSVSQLPKVSADSIEKYQKQTLLELYCFEPTVFQNYPSGKLTYHDVILPNAYSYEENLPITDWTLNEDTATICGYLCQKATTTYGGRKWIVWYAPEIASGYGPWKFGGLPGLVLAAENEEHIFHFTATSIRKSSVPLTFHADAQRLSIKRDRFVKDKIRFESADDPMSLIPVESLSSIAVTKGDGDRTVITMNGIPFRKFMERTSQRTSTAADGTKIIKIGGKSEDNISGGDSSSVNYVPLELE